MGQRLVGGDRLAAAEAAGPDAGAQHVDAVQGGFDGDGLLVAGIGKAVVSDLGPEVLGDLAAAQHPVGAQRDLVLAASGRRSRPAAAAIFARSASVAWRRLSRLRACSASGNGFLQATSRSPGKSGALISARSISSKMDSCNAPSRTSALTCGARSAVIQSRPAGPTSSRSRAAVSMPRSPTSTTRVRANRRPPEAGEGPHVASFARLHCRHGMPRGDHDH